MKTSRFLAISPALFLAGPLFALENVTVMNTAITSGGAPTSSDGYVYENMVQSLNSVSTATANFAVSSLVDNVFVRRNAVNANQSSVWYTGSGSGTNLAGVKQTDYGQMLKGNNVYQGSDNTFSNDPGSTGGNIERIDFTWNSAHTASSDFRFGVFDRGVADVHDSFGIAAVTAIDSLGNPTAYSNLLRVSSGWGGSTNAFNDQGYRLFRYSNGDNTSTSTESYETSSQGIGGVLISTAELGLANGTTIYGYSLMSNDVTNPLNPASFTTNTNGETGGGGIDLAAVNGLEFQLVPEPSALWLGLLGLPSLLALRKGRSARRAGSAASC